jgi:hypothetical protein
VHVPNGRPGAIADSPPSRYPADTESPPANIKRNLLTELNNQSSTILRLTGARKEDLSSRVPTLRHVIRLDLESPVRLLELFRQAEHDGLVRASEGDRLRFFGAAQHARAAGTRNPCGLFATLVRRQRWEYITAADEDAARVQLRRLEELGVQEHLRQPAGLSVHQNGGAPHRGPGTIDARVARIIAYVTRASQFETLRPSSHHPVTVSTSEHLR